MSCIYTGAYVHLPDYGVYCPADLFKVDGVTVVRFSLNPVEANVREPLRKVTHQLFLNLDGNNLFWRPDAAVAVVPSHALRWLTSD